MSYLVVPATTPILILRKYRNLVLLEKFNCAEDAKLLNRAFMYAQRM